MAFKIASSPHAHNHKSTKTIMRTVMAATIPGIITLWYFFGWGSIIQITLAILVALVTEAVVLRLRQRPIIPYLSDSSAALTGLLIGIAIPPLAPWWLVVIGTVFAIIIAKQLYGGLGQNLFNPAMIAYVVLLISFPVQMTSWMPPVEFQAEHLSLVSALSTIFTGHSVDGFSALQLRQTVDGTTMATPLDSVRTALTTGHSSADALKEPLFSGFAGIGWQWVNIAFLIGGLIMLKLRVIQWHIPAAMLASLTVISLIGFLISPETTVSPIIHLFSGATMLGAFFIATDPVSAATTVKGRLIFGAFIGIMVYLIRNFGGFPDGVAFAVILGNICVPLIDYYTRPRTYGY
ncbi:electron transport complex subunit RsxD [Vibrio sp. SS-MA-C1-2]|uniref:electron transport complex subunit RsxD n=1 Tax=Vibrio sp. SS-MA-C1-2 TaxID=2908646 RepID=UPI001F3A4FF3|nr:electron transport complex subunit RsxD [Vibrio sp. SS-MA-C1-2]UJF18709.1 electron transport complex subunit RsxD [Vibrio sp. SS-MA-C1-2]